MPRHTALRLDERGNLTISMLAVLAVTALVTVLIGTVIAGQRQTRFDQSYEQALPAAEIGLNQLATLVETGKIVPPAAATVPEQMACLGCDESGGPVRTENGETYVATAVWRPATNDWLLESTATAVDGQTRRTISVEVALRGLFQRGAYGQLFADFNGGNGVDSYRSGWLTANGTSWAPKANGSDVCKDGTGAAADIPSDFKVWMCNRTGNGVVATNGELFLKGGVIDRVDEAQIHFSSDAVKLAPLTPLPDATGKCSGVAQTCASARLTHHQHPIILDFDPVEMPVGSTDPFPGANPTPTPLTDAGPRHAPRPDAQACTPSAGYDRCIGGGVHVFSNVDLDSRTDIQGTPTDPTIIYLDGTLRVSQHEMVNFERNGVGNWVPRPSPTLLIFSAGAGPALDFGNHAHFAGAIHAPRAAFVGGAQGNIYGALIAGSINNNGGWNFHYDDALMGVPTNAPYRTANWAESR